MYNWQGRKPYRLPEATFLAAFASFFLSFALVAATNDTAVFRVCASTLPSLSFDADGRWYSPCASGCPDVSATTAQATTGRVSRCDGLFESHPLYIVIANQCRREGKDVTFKK